ncbi:MAG TPA: hypothetical protein VM029_09090 [Opitutaceae bacterium]|nr:hypothetical protein [Opitutaceae bacterium]
MKTHSLLSLALAAAFALHAAAATVPEFNSKTTTLPPLALADILKGGINLPTLSFANQPLPVPRTAPGAAPPKAGPEYRMRIVKPDESVDYKLRVQAPNPAIDFKLNVLPPDDPAAK